MKSYPRSEPWNAPPTAASLSGIAKLRTGKPILCERCGKGSGTLVKIADNRYVHTVCLRQQGA